jgi:hypothetical protein
MATSADPVNRLQFVTGALNTFVFNLTGDAEWDLKLPEGYTPIGILANFAAATNVAADNLIITSVADLTVKVYVDTSVETADFSVTAVVFAKKE